MGNVCVCVCGGGDRENFFPLQFIDYGLGGDNMLTCLMKVNGYTFNQFLLYWGQLLKEEISLL